MKKIFLVILSFSLLFSIASADFESEAIKSFKNSPSFEDLDEIKNPIVRYCEETYLKAYMRREFTDFENSICGDFFAKKMEAEYIFKKTVLEERWIY